MAHCDIIDQRRLWDADDMPYLGFDDEVIIIT